MTMPLVDVLFFRSSSLRIKDPLAENFAVPTEAVGKIRGGSTQIEEGRRARPRYGVLPRARTNPHVARRVPFRRPRISPRCCRQILL